MHDKRPVDFVVESRSDHHGEGILFGHSCDQRLIVQLVLEGYRRFRRSDQKMDIGDPFLPAPVGEFGTGKKIIATGIRFKLPKKDELAVEISCSGHLPS